MCPVWNRVFRLASAHVVFATFAACAAFVAGAAGARAAPAGDAYFRIPAGSIEFVGASPSEKSLQVAPPQYWQSDAGVREPRVELDGPGEGYLVGGSAVSWRDVRGPDEARLVVRAPEGIDVTGRLFLPTTSSDGSAREPSIGSIAFRIPASAGEPDHAAWILEARAEHYERLWRANLPGAAWFRHRMNEARAELTRLGASDACEETDADAAGPFGLDDEGSELERTFALYSGGRAMAENLRLDRQLETGLDGERSVELASLGTITVRPYDFAGKMQERVPELDPLAHLVPFDEHAVFFRSFDAFVRLADEADRAGSPLVQLVEDQAIDRATRQRLERQLCVSLNGLARMFGPMLVRSIAFTGSDPYLREGSDVALLFEPTDADALFAALAAEQDRARARGQSIESVESDVAGLSVRGVVAPDRSVCAYLARVGDHVLLTNSMVQVRAVAGVHAGVLPALASLDEYRYFRDLYPRGAEDESALLVMSDATIRRWCGPKWRIGASRRTRAASLLTEHRARSIDGGPPPTAAEIAAEADLRATYGTLEFMTPIAELDIDRVTQAEARAYERFRDTYQREWRNYFDPIAARVHADDGGITGDVTVMPLVANSDMRDMLELCGKATIDANDGDPHDGAILHMVLAFDPRAREAREMGDLFGQMSGKAGINAVGWIGDHVGFFIDDAPIWDRVLQLEDMNAFEDFLLDHFNEMPLAAFVAVKDPLGAAAFVTAARAFAMESAPGLLRFESVPFGDGAYVKVSAAIEELRGPSEDGEPSPPFAIYYGFAPGLLVITPSETLMKEALTRGAARLEDRGAAADARKWLGRSFAAVARKRFATVFDHLSRASEDALRRQASIANLPILNEWKRIFPDEDPVAVHERLWGERLLCPGGGEYVWNGAERTMESTAYGSPGQPRSEATAPSLLELFGAGRFGLTFSDDALRARFELEK